MQVKYLTATCLVLLLALGCSNTPDTPTARYAEAVEDALGQEGNRDEIIYGLRMDVADQVFYDRCTELNKAQRITNGTAGNEIIAREGEEQGWDSPVFIRLAPHFTDDTPRMVKGFRIHFDYEEWSPWNQDAQSDKLLPEVVRYLSDSLSTTFTQLPVSERESLMVAVDDNRHVVVKPVSARRVTATITDLSRAEEDPLGLISK